MGDRPLQSVVSPREHTEAQRNHTDFTRTACRYAASQRLMPKPAASLSLSPCLSTLPRMATLPITAQAPLFADSYGMLRAQGTCVTLDSMSTAFERERRQREITQNSPRSLLRTCISPSCTTCFTPPRSTRIYLDNGPKRQRCNKALSSTLTRQLARIGRGCGK